MYAQKALHLVISWFSYVLLYSSGSFALVLSRYLSSCTVQVLLCILLYSSGPFALCTVQVPLLLYCPGSVLFVLLTRSLHSSYRLLVERVWPSYLRKQKGLPVELSKIEGQLSWIYCNWQIYYIHTRICLKRGISGYWY